MVENHDIFAIIPALNEASSIGLVLHDLTCMPLHTVIVVDNGSTDGTAEAARAHGAVVVAEKARGYGAACLRGMKWILDNAPHPDRTIVLFLDGDHSDHPEQAARLVQPVIQGHADLVIGSRQLGNAQKGSMTPQQIAGNRIATGLIWLLYGRRYTDLGPFRAITWTALERLDMQDRDYGWTVEMQVKALKKGLRILERPVDYRRRTGRSKISGTVKGTVMAGYRIVTTILRHA